MLNIPTRRERNGWLAFGSITILLLTLSSLELTHETLNIALASTSLINWQIVMSKWRLYLVSPVVAILFVLLICWSVRNRLDKGPKQAIRRWRLTKQLRKAILLARYETSITHQNVKYAILPEIKIYFDDKKMDSGQVWIRSSTRDNIRLAKAEISPDIKGYKLEQSYISEDGDWHIYYIYSVHLQIQPKFDSLIEYVSWALDGVNDYQLKFDNRLITDLSNIEIIGATRSGKTYALLGLLIQIINKELDYELYFADPKNGDWKNYGNYIAQDKVATEDNDICDLIDRVHSKMLQRQQIMNRELKSKASADYRDFKLDPIILVFDEYPSWHDSMSDEQDKSSKEKFKTAQKQLKRISQMGSGSGVFMILVFQKIDAQTLSKSIQSNMLLKIVLGNADNQTYITAIDRKEDVPQFIFGQGQGIYKNERMVKPRLLGFPYLRFIDDFNDHDYKTPKDMFKKISN